MTTGVMFGLGLHLLSSLVYASTECTGAQGSLKFSILTLGPASKEITEHHNLVESVWQ